MRPAPQHVGAVTILLVRHPPPDIAPGVCYGRLDIGLRAPPPADLVAAMRAHRPAHVWSSPARRCRAIAEALAPLPARFDTRLLELDFGDWEGLAWDEVPRDALDAWAADPLGFAPPGGESGAHLLARVRAFHADLVRESAPCAVVSHGGPLKLLAALLRGEPPDLLAPAPAIGSLQAFSRAASRPRP